MSAVQLMNWNTMAADVSSESTQFNLGVMTMARYYRLANGTNGVRQNGGRIWSHDIAVCFEPVKFPVALGEDIGHGGIGTTVTAREALDNWASHFVVAGGEWLIPFITRMAAGATVDADEVVGIFKARTGYMPSSFDSSGG